MSTSEAIIPKTILDKIIATVDSFIRDLKSSLSSVLVKPEEIQNYEAKIFSMKRTIKKRDQEFSHLIEKI
jgi:DNA repair ATPase RecN